MERLAIIQIPVQKLGNDVLFFIRELGRIALFFAKGTLHIFSYPFQFRKLLEQIYFIGMKSVVVVALTGAFTGMVLGFQGYYTLVKFGSEGLLGTLVSLTLIRELGPVLTAIMVTGRAGSAMAAELGIMRISEQIDALETMDINSIRFLYSPRLAAALFSFPLLTALFDTVGIIGGYLTGCVLLGINSGLYFYRTEFSVHMTDINGGFIKALVFGAVVVTICCFQGYYTHTRKEGFGAKGVGSATTSAVVISCVLILATDYVLTSFLM
ncbi:MAG: ABC transporter permease [Desulfococcaceae bacterium]|jgi:phospholipid/cholesterol/gamma-HCH transport system permease protein|nr:ABC transporter permease [Desulfococcaceae bacterium]